MDADISVGEALKIDLEETKSMYSFADDESVTSSRISQPTKYRATESIMSASTYHDERRNDYPEMSASSSSSCSTQGRPDRYAKCPAWQNIGKTELEDDDDDEKNPWTSQPSRKARKPKEESLNFNPNRGTNL